MRAGWHETFDASGGYEALTYRFGDNAPDWFMARCADGRMTFDLRRDDFPPDGATPYLDIDGARWDVSDAVERPSGGIVLWSDEFASRFRAAKERIAFIAGTRRIAFSPHPHLLALIDHCRELAAKKSR